MSDDIKKIQDIDTLLNSGDEQSKAFSPFKIGDALKDHKAQNTILGRETSSIAGHLKSLQNSFGGALAAEEMRRRDLMETANRQAQVMADHQRRLAEVQHRRDNPVLAVFEELQNYIREFESSLKDDEVVGARLVAFGQDTKFHVTRLGYSTPCLIHFDGIDQDGNRVRLVQNVTQLSVLFVAMRLRDGEEKSPIGFVHHV